MENEKDKDKDNELPAGWVETKLGDISDIAYGKGLPTSFLKKTGFPVFGANGVIGYYDSYLFVDRQVLISCRGAYSGKINMSLPKSYVTNNSLIVLTDQDSVSRDYLYYSLQAANKSKIVTGTAQPQVTINNATEVKIPLPPLAEQHRIVAKLEELFSELDKGVETLRVAQQQLKVYRQAVLQWAFEGKLTEEWRKVQGISNTVREERLDSKSQIIGGLTKNANREKLSRKMPYLRVANVYSNRFSLENVEEIGVNEREIERVLLKKGDLLIVEGNGSIEQIGRAALWGGQIDNCLHQNHLIKVRPNGHVVGKYLLYYLISRAGRKEIEAVAASTSGLYTLNLSKIAQLTVPMRENSEQQQIVAEIESRLSVCDKLEETITQSLLQAEALRQSILKKAFAGRLVPQDPGDEPAEKLLARIRAERAAATPVKKISKGRTAK